MANSIIQVDLVKIEIPKSHKIFTDPSPVEWCDDDGEYYHHCVKVRTSSASPSADSDPKDQNSRTHHTSATIPGTAKVTTEPLRRHAVDIYDKVPTASNVNPSPDLRPEKHRDRLCQDTTVSASSDTVQGTANPFGEPTVGIGDSAPTALLCVEPPVYVNPVKHVYRTCNTSPSTCVSAGQVSIKPVGEPTINICDSAASESLCADSEVCMDEDEHVYSSRDTPASTCGSAGQVFIEPVGEPNINICDNAASESPCAYPEVCMDEDEHVYSARDTTASTCGSAGQVFIEPVGEPNINICDNAASESLCAHSEVCMDEDEHVYSARDTPASTCGSAGQVSIKPVREPTISICDSAASESLCTDFKVCMDKDKRVYKASDTSASTCHEVGQVLAVPICGSEPIQSFGANTALCIKARDHRYRSHRSIHTPAKAIMPAVGVITSSSGSVFDDSPTISPIADISLEAKTEKCRDTGGGRVLCKFPISKAVTVKVVASSEHADEMCDVHQMEKVLKVKIIATSEMEPSCKLSNDVPTLLARGVINSWQEVMEEELEDEVNCVFKVKPHDVVEEPAAKNVSANCLESTKGSVTPVFSFLLPNTAKGDAVKQKKVMSSPSASHVGFAECHFEHKHWERTKVPLVRESISRNLEKDHALFGTATESADSACATENSSMELINEEDMVVPVSAAIVTNAAFTSAAASGTMDTESGFFHIRQNLALPCETSFTIQSPQSQEQGARNTTLHNSSDSARHCGDVRDMLSTVGQLKNDRIASETSELATSLREVQANTQTEANQKPVIVETMVKPQSPLDGSDVDIQESLAVVGKPASQTLFTSSQEEQRADQHNLTVSKDFSTELFNLPNRSEAVLAENSTIASEIEISVQPPEPLEKCGGTESVATDHIFSSPPGSPSSSQSVNEAVLPEQLAVVNKIPSVVLPSSLQNEGEGTDSAMHCHKSLDLPSTDELSNSLSTSEASSPGHLRAVIESSTVQIRPLKKKEGTESAATSDNPLAQSSAITELPCQPSSNEASLPEVFVSADETTSLELPMCSQEAWSNTEDIDSYLDPVAFPHAPGGLSSMQSISEGSLPGNPGASKKLTRYLLKEGEATASAVNCYESLPQPSAIGELPHLHNTGETLLQDEIPATTEAISLSESLCNEQADTEGMHGHHKSVVSRATTNWSSSPCRSEASSPEGSMVANETSSVELLEPPQKAHGGSARTDVKHCEHSAASNAITEISGLPKKGEAYELGPVEDPLTASLYIAESMWNMKTCSPHNVILQAAGTEGSETLLAQEPPIKSIGLKVWHYTMLKSHAESDTGRIDGCLSPTPSTLPQPPTGSLKRKRSQSPSATPSSTVKVASSAGADLGTLQQCISAALLQPSSILSNKPLNDEVQEGVTTVSMGTDSDSNAMLVSGRTTQGQAIVFSVPCIRKRKQTIAVKLPPNIVTTGDTQTATVSSSGSPAHVQKKRTKGRKPPASTTSEVTSTSAAHQSKEQEEKKKPTLPSGQKTSRTGCAIIDKLADIDKALAIPITRQDATLANASAPKSKRNANAPGRRGKACTNKKVRMPRKWRQAVPRREVKQAPSRKRKGIAQSEQVVPDTLHPVLSPTSSELSSISSKPSKSSSSGASNNAAGSDSTCKTRSSAWQSLSSCKSAQEYVQIINRLFPMEESGSGFPGYHPVLANRPPYNGDKKSSVIAPKRRRTEVTPARETTEAAPANASVELERYVSELSASTDVGQYDSVLSELFDRVA